MTKVNLWALENMQYAEMRGCGCGSICAGMIRCNGLKLNGKTAADGDGCGVQWFRARQTTAEEQTPFNTVSKHRSTV
jgi:hypothetical protein